MSVIRLCGCDKERLVELADKILLSWRGYSDESVFVFAESDGEPHNTITPIARRRGKDFELDLVLRNNITTDEHPMGVFHPHAELHNIKKENIGLIEVMGLAVLPSRLKTEIALMAEAACAGVSFEDIPEIRKHGAWFDAFRDAYEITSENAVEIIKAEIGKTFVRVLSDAGVFKDTEDGEAAFMRFVGEVG
jgi:UDPglucose--hexose-1-phosphate uridylyltransferase